MSKVAVVQLVSGSTVQDNLKQLPALFTQACEQGVSLIVLPENFAFMGVAECDKLAIAEILGQGEIQAFLQNLARSFQMWIVAGTLPIRASKTHVTASSLVYNDQGVCVARYDKMHLFDVNVTPEESYQESRTIVPGTELVVVATPIGKIGLSVCYDLRFPELYRALVAQGAQILVVPAAFTAKTGLAHWQVLLQARAIENLCYVLAANQGGYHENGRQTYGHSMIVDPWGKVLASLEQGAGLVMTEINLPQLYALRQSFPCLKHRVLRSH